MKDFKILDLFCGAGGLSLGFSKAGFLPVAGVDNDDEALITYRQNIKGASAINYDLTSVSSDFFKKIEKPDVILGGPPCQGFSIAGKRNVDDPRNKLFESYIKIVATYKPKALVIENVPNILSMGGGMYKEKIISALKDLGYNVGVYKVNAADLGVPQSRRRVFFIAIKGHSIDFTQDLLKGTAQPITTREAIGDLPLLDGEQGEEVMKYKIAPQNEYQRLMRKGSDTLHNHSAVAHTAKTKEIIAMVPDGGNYKSLPKNLQNTRRVNIAWTRMNSNKPCFTIDAGHNHHFHYKANRVPTVRECARIQSFPDKFIFYGKRTSQYRQVGNAVPPLLAEYIARLLIKIL